MTRLLCHSEQIVIKLKSSQYVHGWYMRDDFMAFRENNMLCGDIRTETVEHEICLLTSALNHIATLVRTDRSSQ